MNFPLRRNLILQILSNQYLLSNQNSLSKFSIKCGFWCKNKRHLRTARCFLYVFKNTLKTRRKSMTRFRTICVFWQEAYVPGWLLTSGKFFFDKKVVWSKKQRSVRVTSQCMYMYVLVACWYWVAEWQFNHLKWPAVF